MARKETPWGTWDHIPFDELIGLLAGLKVPWWIAGGFAIDAFAGAGRRDHDDIDVSLFFDDHLVVKQHLRDWELHYADPPGALDLWPSGLQLPAHVHDIWARRNETDPWRFQLMLNPRGPDTVTYRRDERVSLPFEAATWLKNGVRYLAPEYQLLFKSRTPRPKDQQDFDDCLPLLDTRRRAWLVEALRLTDPGNAWLGRL